MLGTDVVVRDILREVWTLHNIVHARVSAV